MMCFSSLVALLLLTAAFFLGSMFLGSVSDSDQRVAIVIGVVTALYIIGPAFLVRRFYRAERYAAASLTLAIWNVVGVTTIMLFLGGIASGSRP